MDESHQTDLQRGPTVAAAEKPDAPQHRAEVTGLEDGKPSEDDTAGTEPEYSKRESGSSASANVADADYACDRETVRSLAYLIDAGGRARVDAWLAKLDECDDPEVRSLYAKFLLKAVAGGNARAEPFRHLPHDGPLRRLREVVDPALLLGLTRENAPGEDRTAARRTPDTRVTRETFYGRQPIPENGLYCYAAAFSDTG